MLSPDLGGPRRGFVRGNITIKLSKKRTRGQRAAAWFAALGLISGCVSILGLDDYGDASDELCTLYAQCYGADAFPNCKQHVAQGIDGGGADVAQWLSGFFDEGCLQDCKSARSCVDSPPVCGGAAAGCEVDEQCCSFSEGLAICAEGACCLDLGALCESDSQCCNAACVEIEGANYQTCGGVECNAVGEGCEDGVECCSENCFEGSCLAPCSDDGLKCAEDGECCSERCTDGECACAPDGTKCTSAGECCGKICESGECQSECDVAGTDCGTAGGACCSKTCFDGTCCNPPGKDCNTDDECCAGACEGGKCRCSAPGGSCDDNDDCCLANARCNEAGICFCAGPGDDCEESSDCCVGDCGSAGTCDCGLEGEGCMGPLSCCSALCDGGTCGCLGLQEECLVDHQCCNLALCREFGPKSLCCNQAAACVPALSGGPLVAACTVNPQPLDPKCPGYGKVRAICMDGMPQCCCEAWTQECVDAYDDVAFCPAITGN